MKELVRNILVYVVIVSVMRGLIDNPKYRQYFQFFSGIIMILLMLSPVLSLFQSETAWYEILEEKILQMDLESIQGEMEIADDRFAEMVKEEYKETVSGQIQTLAEEKGLHLKEVAVEVREKEGEWRIEKVTAVTEEDLEQKGDSVETVWATEGQRVRKEDTSKLAKALRKQICNYFVIGEDKVHIWK